MLWSSIINAYQFFSHNRYTYSLELHVLYMYQLLTLWDIKLYIEIIQLFDRVLTSRAVSWDLQISKPVFRWTTEKNTVDPMTSVRKFLIVFQGEIMPNWRCWMCSQHNVHKVWHLCSIHINVITEVNCNISTHRAFKLHVKLVLLRNNAKLYRFTGQIIWINFYISSY